jgi:hypothetical protein
MESQPGSAGGLAAGGSHLLWGWQSCLQPPFRRLLRAIRESSRQDFPLRNLCSTITGSELSLRMRVSLPRGGARVGMNAHASPRTLESTRAAICICKWGNK